MPTKGKQEERRRASRTTLLGAALIAPQSKTQKAMTAVLDNANRIGIGLHTKEAVAVQEPVTVTLVFLDQEGDEQQEKLAGKVAWVKPWEKGYLIGVVFDEVVTKEKNRFLHSYLEETLKETA